MLSGECFQQLCDIYVGRRSNLFRNPVIAKERDKHCDIDALDKPICNGRRVFCYSNDLQTFMKKLHLFQNPMILVSHNEDTNITEDFLPIAKDEKIIVWYAQNCMIHHPKVIWLPIGFANSMYKHGNSDIVQSVQDSSIAKTKDIYFFFTVRTNSDVRNACRKIVLSKGLQWGSLQN
jgi:hypothetical protein